MAAGVEAMAFAQRAAAEAFVYVMRRFGVRTHEIAVEVWAPRRYRVAPPFWPVTVESGRTGYAVNTRGEFISYTQRDLAPGAEFGPSCQRLLARATSANPAFVCEPLRAAQARETVVDYLVDAALSLAGGNGPVVVGVVTSAPPRDTEPAALECSTPWRASSPRSSTESYRAGSSTRTTRSSPS